MIYNFYVETRNNLYSNIITFIENNGFKIIFLDKHKISFTFSDDKVIKSRLHFDSLMDEAQSVDNDELREELYKKAWDNWDLTQEEYYPKLEKILDSLDLFYSDRNTSLEFRLFFNNDDLLNLSLGFNKLHKRLFPDQNEFDSKIENELLAYDNFLKVSNIN